MDEETLVQRLLSLLIVAVLFSSSPVRNLIFWKTNRQLTPLPLLPLITDSCKCSTDKDGWMVGWMDGWLDGY